MTRATAHTLKDGSRLLAGKTIMVTGASRGIGAAIARVCSREGAGLILGYRTGKESAENLASELRSEHDVEAMTLGFDIRDPRALETAFAAIGDRRVHGWVNNAGVHHSGLLPTLSEEMIREQVEVNLLGPIHACRLVIPRMMTQGGGSIVNIGSVTATKVAQGQSVYAATKGALVSLTRALAFEYGRRAIRVNCIEPGPVATDMLAATLARAGDDIVKRIPLRRLGMPEDVAELAAFLLSDKASFLTGGVFTADGGYSLG